MNSEHEHDLAAELHAMRAKPSQEYARGLDRRAAVWLRQERRRRFEALRVLVPVAAAAAAVVAAVLIGSGGGDDAAKKLAVRVEPVQPAEGLSATPRRDSAAAAKATAYVTDRDVGEGEPVLVAYAVSEPTRAHLELAQRETSAELPAGAGRLEISTDGLAPGSYPLVVKIPPLPRKRESVTIAGR